MPDRMTFWRGNRLDAEFTREIQPLAFEFWASKYGQAQLTAEIRLEVSLRMFLTDPAGFNSVWTDEAAIVRAL